MSEQVGSWREQAGGPIYINICQPAPICPSVLPFVPPSSLLGAGCGDEKEKGKNEEQKRKKEKRRKRN